ncbi:MAG: adenylate/guanylate cyclase domain-containing protein [Pseudomonadales bacterium]|nr:adenylate/guanylate cyclase domain-containing protein [Pseudomonadales bacterium]
MHAPLRQFDIDVLHDAPRPWCFEVLRVYLLRKTFSALPWGLGGQASLGRCGTLGRLLICLGAPWVQPLHPHRLDVVLFRLFAYGVLFALLARASAPPGLLLFVAAAPALSQLPCPRVLRGPLWTAEAFAIPAACLLLGLPSLLAYLAAALALLGLALVHGVAGLLAALPLVLLPPLALAALPDGRASALAGFWLLFAPFGALALLLCQRRWRGEHRALRAFLPSGLQRRRRSAKESPWGIVLVADLVNYSASLEQGGPASAGGLLDGFYRHAGAALRDSGGAFDRFCGDGLLAYFRAEPGEARYATVARALRCVTVLGQFGALPGGAPLRQGVSAGPLLTSALGQEATGRGWALLGVAVVEAHRLQTLAPPGGVALAGALGPYLSGPLRPGPGAWRRLKGLARPRWVLLRRLGAGLPKDALG